MGSQSMSDDPDRAVVLTTAATEVEGAMIVAALEEHGVQAQMTGALTSGFRAEAPGGLQIIVRYGDLDQAQSALRAIEKESDSG